MTVKAKKTVKSSKKSSSPSRSRVRVGSGSPKKSAPRFFVDKWLAVVTFIVVFGSIGSYLLFSSNAASSAAILSSGQTLAINSSLVSPNGIMKLNFQSDGNLVLRNIANTAVWSSGTYGKGGNRVVMQSDGNLVMYNGGTPIWNTKTAGKGSSFAQVQNDGNFVVYTAAGVATWQSGTSGQAGSASAPTAPANLETFVGGNSISLVWDVPSYSVKYIEVYRNNVMIHTVSPNNGVLENQVSGNEFDDTAAAIGTAYQYKIRAISPVGGASPFSAVVQATQPVSRMVAPTILIDTTQTPDLTAFMTNSIKPLVATWYPKVAQNIAYPNYTPPTTIKIFIDPKTTKNVPGAACYAASGETPATVHCDPGWLRTAIAGNDSDIAATFVHETTHLIQAGYPNDPTGWATEGGASWASNFYARQHKDPYIPGPSAVLGNYSPGAFFIQYIRTKYDANFPRKLNVALHTNTYTASLVPNSTGGKSIAQVWAEAKAAYNTATGPISGIAGKCVDVQNGTVALGTKIQLLGCTGANQQKWALTYQDSTKKSPTSDGTFSINSPLLGAGSYCLDILNSGTTSGSKVQFWSCNGSNNQLWRHGLNGSLVNVNSGLCLATTNNGSDSGNQLVIATCNASTGQNWTTPQ